MILTSPYLPFGMVFSGLQASPFYSPNMMTVIMANFSFIKSQEKSLKINKVKKISLCAVLCCVFYVNFSIQLYALFQLLDWKVVITWAKVAS